MAIFKQNSWQMQDAAQATDAVGITDDTAHDPRFARFMGDLPHPIALAGFTTARASETALYGGWSRSAFPNARVFGEGLAEGAIGLPGTKGAMNPRRLGAGIRRLGRRMNPRTMRRFSNIERVDPEDFHTTYVAGTNIDRALRFKFSPLRPLGKLLENRGMVEEATRASPDTAGRLLGAGFMTNQVTSYRLSRMAELTPRVTGNLANFSRVSDPNMWARMSGYEGPAFAADAQFSEKAVTSELMDKAVAERFAAMSPLDASQVVGMAGRAPLNRFLGGAIQGSLNPITDAAFEAAGGAASWGVKGATWSAESLAYGGMLPGERMGVKGFVSGFRSALSGEGPAMAAEKLAGSGIEGAGRGIIQQGVENATERVAVAAGEKVVADVGEKVALDVGEKVAVEGGLKLGGRFAVGAALAEVPVVGWAVDIGLAAWTAYDIGKAVWHLGSDLAKSQAQMAKDASKSFQGSINKAPFSGWRGLGYQDTEAAFTSRKRGVNAISNSRLNARSVLGSESAMLHAHFG